MKNNLLISLLFFMFFSCSSKKQLVYFSDSHNNNINKIKSNNNEIKIGDILKIDVHTVIPEVSIPYNLTNKNITNNSIENILLDGYVVDKNMDINYPILGKISVSGFTEFELALKLTDLLTQKNHLSNPYVIVRKVNSKFTVLGEVANPGTFSFFDSRLNVFQALGYAGDLLITAKRKDIKLIREENGLYKTYIFSLNKSELLNKPYFLIKSNDIIIVEPNFSKVKSAGFVGSPASIASISSILLSITLLLINN